MTLCAVEHKQNTKKKKKNRKCVEKKLKKMKWGNEAKRRRSQWGRDSRPTRHEATPTASALSSSPSLSLPECVLHSPLLGAQSTLQFSPRPLLSPLLGEVSSFLIAQHLLFPSSLLVAFGGRPSDQALINFLLNGLKGAERCCKREWGRGDSHCHTSSIWSPFFMTLSLSLWLNAPAGGADEETERETELEWALKRQLNKQLTDRGREMGERERREWSSVEQVRVWNFPVGN